MSVRKLDTGPDDLVIDGDDYATLKGRLRDANASLAAMTARAERAEAAVRDAYYEMCVARVHSGPPFIQEHQERAFGILHAALASEVPA